MLLAEGKPQEFGTQNFARQGQWVPRPLRDPENIDQRRAAMSLEPLAEYLADIAAYYGPPAPPHIRCAECDSSFGVWLPDPGGQLNVDCPNCGYTIEITVDS